MPDDPSSEVSLHLLHCTGNFNFYCEPPRWLHIQSKGKWNRIESIPGALLLANETLECGVVNLRLALPCQEI